MAIDGNFFQGPFCVHMGVVFQKNALLTLLQFARVKRTHQPHVFNFDSMHLEIEAIKPNECLDVDSMLQC